MAINKKHPLQYDLKVTSAFTAQLACVHASTAPSEWAAAIYGLLTMPRLARYTPDAAVPDLWVPDDSSCVGMLFLAVDHERKTLFDAGQPFQKDTQLLLDHGSQQQLAETLFGYVYDPQQPFVQDMLLPIENYKGVPPHYLVLHLQGHVNAVTHRYEPTVIVRTAKFPL